MNYSTVAQLVEQTAVNRPVVGSSPTRGAIFKDTLMEYAITILSLAVICLVVVNVIDYFWHKRIFMVVYNMVFVSFIIIVIYYHQMSIVLTD